jgi:hypothetical protein
MVEKWYLDIRDASGAVLKSHGPFVGCLEATAAHRSANEAKECPNVSFGFRGCLCQIRGGPKNTTINRDHFPVDKR